MASHIYEFAPTAMCIIRHGSDKAPARLVHLPVETRDRLNAIRAGLVMYVNAHRGIESAVDAWQEILSVYFAHWEE